MHVNIEVTISNFIELLTPLLETCDLENVFNTDKSGLRLEIKAGRPPALTGMRKKESIARYI